MSSQTVVCLHLQTVGVFAKTNTWKQEMKLGDCVGAKLGNLARLLLNTCLLLSPACLILLLMLPDHGCLLMLLAHCCLFTATCSCCPLRPACFICHLASQATIYPPSLPAAFCHLAKLPFVHPHQLSTLIIIIVIIIICLSHRPVVPTRSCRPQSRYSACLALALCTHAGQPSYHQSASSCPPSRRHRLTSQVVAT